MPEVLVATLAGCLTFDSTGQRKVDFAGRQVGALALEPAGSCLAVIDGNEIWKRSSDAQWSQLLTTSESLCALVCFDGKILLN